MPIGRLEKVPLRGIWPNEARDFTTWLAEKLDFLGKALGLSLSLVEQEAAAGIFSADVLSASLTGSSRAKSKSGRPLANRSSGSGSTTVGPVVSATV